MKTRKIITITLLVCTFYILGYIRYSLFLTVNEQAADVFYHASPPQLNSLLSFLNSKSYNWLLNFKWGLTLLFTIIYCIFSSFSVFILFKNKSYIKICILLYSSMLIVSAIFIGIGYIFQDFSHHAFNLARNIMHLGQSPLITLLILAGLYFYRNFESAT